MQASHAACITNEDPTSTYALFVAMRCSEIESSSTQVIVPNASDGLLAVGAVPGAVWQRRTRPSTIHCNFRGQTLEAQVVVAGGPSPCIAVPYEPSTAHQRCENGGPPHCCLLHSSAPPVQATHRVLLCARAEIFLNTSLRNSTLAAA